MTPRTTIPLRTADLDALSAEVDRLTQEVTGLVAPLSDEAFRWRPGPDRWSVAGHVAHMALVTGPYLAPLRASLAEAREKGRTGDGPFRHPWVARWFANSMEPPPRKRVRTLAAMVPDPDAADPLESFTRVQADLARAVEEARGVDLGRARFSSPFMKLLRLSVGTAFHALLAHTRRHVWLAREVMDAPGFPGVRG